MAAPRIRAAVAADAAAINRIYNHYVQNTVITFDVTPWNTRRRRTWIERLHREHRAGAPYHVIVAEEHGEIAGFACNSPFRPKGAYHTSTETTIYLAAHCHGRGLGHALYRALFRLLTATPLHRAYAVIALPNPRSIAFHRDFGFTAAGTLREVGHKFGRYVDITWFEKALDAPATEGGRRG